LAWLNQLFTQSTEIFNLLATTVLILAGGMLLIKIGDASIKRIFHLRQRNGSEIQPRERTLIHLLESCARYGIYFIMAVTILDRFGVPVLAILSTAGVLGVGIAFGAQSLFKDVISGFFILLENQYSVGEYIGIQGVEGFVEQVTLRCTYLRDFAGQLHILPNGSIGTVTNHSRGSRRALVEVGVAYDSDLEHVVEVLEQVCEETAAELTDILDEKPVVQGIAAFGDSAIVFRITAKAKALQQWTVEMRLRRRIKEAFQRESIEIPYPRCTVTMLNGEPKINLEANHDRL
jgi:small conductance mechanosensitive channel